MPELPEVESIRRYLVASNIQGATIQRVEIGWPDSIAAPTADIETFANKVSNTQIGPLNRRGKYLVSPLIDGDERQSHLVLHMGMTGSLHIRNPNDDPVRYRRAAFYLNDDRRIELNDSRRWARLWAVDDPTTAYPQTWPRALESNPRPIRRAHPNPNAPASNPHSSTSPSSPESATSTPTKPSTAPASHPVRRCNRISLIRLHQLHANILTVARSRPEPHHNPPQPRR